jgi:hypothetical protein
MLRRLSAMLQECRFEEALTPSADISNRVSSLAIASQILPRLTSILSRELDLKNTKDPQRLPS